MKIYQWLLLFAALMTIVTFFVYIDDRFRKKMSLDRISEIALMMLSVCGGAVGGYLAMVIFKHKMDKPRFHAVQIISICCWILMLVLIAAGENAGT